jgi:diaminohydroxyphosphoribosylaminopyrimidine deaminase/5-amino-6-(5-phosphoribosylamino)uracil reductase
MRLPVGSRLTQTASEIPTILFSSSVNEEKRRQLVGAGVDVSEIDARDLIAVLRALRDREIQSVLVEGGTEIAGAFLDARLVDKVTFIIAPIIIGGREAPIAIGGAGVETIARAPRLRDLITANYGEDIEITGYPQFPDD